MVTTPEPGTSGCPAGLGPEGVASSLTVNNRGFGGVLEWAVRKWAARRDGTLMGEQFGAGYRAGMAAGLRMGREEARHGWVSQTPVWEVASQRKAS